MASIYRSDAGRDVIRYWCTDQLEHWVTPHDTGVTTANGARTHAVISTTAFADPSVLFVPGTNFNAASSLPLASALAQRRRTILLDVPGQPGLSDGDRGIAGGRLDWYGRWLADTIDQVTSGPVIVVGHSFGAAIAMSTTHSRISGQVLVSPGGLTRLRITPGVLAASSAWLALPGDKHSAWLLRAMHRPGFPPRSELVDWMTLVAKLPLQWSTRPGGAADSARPSPGCQRCS